MTNDYQKLTFYNPTKGNLSFNQVLDEVFGYIKEEPKEKYEIVVGCDSASDIRPSFPVVLVVLRKGLGGRFFLTRIKYSESEKKKFYNFQQRIIQEVCLSCEMALQFREAIREKIGASGISFNYQFEYIHADVGQVGPTKDMIKEVVGLIKSNGFEPMIKPGSFAASVVADRFS